MFHFKSIRTNIVLQTGICLVLGFTLIRAYTTWNQIRILEGAIRDDFLHQAESLAHQLEGHLNTRMDAARTLAQTFKPFTPKK